MRLMALMVLLEHPGVVLTGQSGAVVGCSSYLPVMDGYLL